MPLIAAQEPGVEEGAPVDAAPAASKLPDADLAPYRIELLDRAFEVASALPLEPHHKTRAREQQAVVETAIRMGRLQQAHDLAGDILNWRRGYCFAELAFALAKSGQDGPIEALLAQALESAQADPTAADQEWRLDRVQVAVARTHLWLGATERAEALRAASQADEASRLWEVKLARGEGYDPAVELSALDIAVRSGGLDLYAAAHDSAAELFDRFYDDDELRAKVRERVGTTWEGGPLLITIGALLDLADVAIDHDDREEALSLLAAARAKYDAVTWSAEHSVPLRARMASIRYRSEGREAGLAEVDEALVLYEEGLYLLEQPFRAQVLRPIAEAYHELGEAELARILYARVVEVGADNPNARPRAEDLVGTMLSMAEHAYEPDAELAERLAELQAGLQAPW